MQGIESPEDQSCEIKYSESRKDIGRSEIDRLKGRGDEVPEKDRQSQAPIEDDHQEKEEETQGSLAIVDLAASPED